MRIGYARVSTSEQQPVSQIDALTEAGCERIYTETASGARRDRPELARALDAMRDGDTLVVWKLDRLARSLGQLIETVWDLDQRGIGFVSLTDQIDTTSAGGRLLFHIMGAIAEFERDLIRERTRAGLDAARARGRMGGRRKLSAADVEAAKAMVRAGTTPVAAAERLGVSLATLYRYAPAIRDNVQD
ncbi:MAG TPA: recombinase family protein [Rubrobacter sp.]|nr:recombinase family protein [Rubrobacter sp.]